MIDIARWLESRLKADQYREQHRDGHELRVASAALLIEAARADYHFSDDERARLEGLLRERFALSDEETAALVAEGTGASRDAVSLTALTQVVNRHCGLEERVRLLHLLWQVALADNKVDKYEEYVIRKVANLLHLSHDDYIRARLQAQGDHPA